MKNKTRVDVALESPIFIHTDKSRPQCIRPNFPFASLLTFDMHHVDQTDEERIKKGAIDGWTGLWHARVTLTKRETTKEDLEFLENLGLIPLARWSQRIRDNGTLVLKRLLARCGAHEATYREDQVSLHGFRWARPEELARALRAPNYIQYKTARDARVEAGTTKRDLCGVCAKICDQRLVEGQWVCDGCTLAKAFTRKTSTTPEDGYRLNEDRGYYEETDDTLRQRIEAAFTIDKRAVELAAEIQKLKTEEIAP